MQDPNPIPWGALDRYQAHFIVKKDMKKNVTHYVSRTKLTTKGHFGTKTVVKVEWEGHGSLATRLNEDSELNNMIAKQSVRDASIIVEPTKNAIRIRSGWKNHLDFGITKDLFEIYDRIAGHIKNL